jgi:electron transfer flavoprotein alpha subunit
MPVVLVVTELADGKPTKSALELLTLARRLGDPVAVVLGGGPEGAAEQLGQYGATRVLFVADPSLLDCLVAPKAEAVTQVAEAESPAAVLISATPEGKEIAGRVAVRLNAGLITDATDVSQDGSTLQSVFAGNWTVQASVTGRVAVIAVKANAVAPELAPAAGVAEQAVVTISEQAKGARIVKSEPKQASGRPELTEAAIVVSGGRGTGGDFGPVEQLADSLGAAVGASRAAVDSGWYPHAYQIGQTGKTVSPQLYIAAGISGAIQHRAGMQTSKAIVAVNKDPEAPIFALADLGIVGDLRTILPAVTQEITRRRA